MTRLLDSGVSPDADSSGEEGVSAISAAASGGYIDAVQLLLQRGADVNDDNFWGGNALVGASLFGHVKVVKLLLAHGCDPSAVDDGVTALDYVDRHIVAPEGLAPRRDYIEIDRLLRANGGQHGLIHRFIPIP